jgi:predicted nucleotidyltransferase component of viral defense system
MQKENTRAVEKFHLLFLTQLGTRVDKKLYALKGGCNLRFFFKSIRYSEDIDFDVHTISRQTLQKNVNQIFDSSGFRQILRSAKMEIARLSEPKQTDTTQRWKVHVQIEGPAPKLPTRIEFSRRRFDTGVLFEPVDPEIVRTQDLRPVLASHYGLEAALAQKIDALASRAQTQARDVFDLAWLIERSGQELRLRGDKRTLTAACENAMSVSSDQFKSQVVAYLLPEYQEYYGTQKAWNSLQENVVRILAGL